MSNVLGVIAYFAITIGLMILLFTFGRKYVFSKVRINKYIPLGIAIVLFILQIFMPAILGKNIVWVSFLLTILTVTFFLWFMDIVTTGGPKQKEKKIEIRPKAKPNRVKHLNNAQNNTNNKK